MPVERLNIVARADRFQVHRRAARVHSEFFRRVHNFSAQAFALMHRIHAEQTQIHSVLTLLEVDTTDRNISLFEKQKFASGQIFQRAVAVNAITADKRTLDFKRCVDEFRQRVDVRILSEPNRVAFSSGKNRAARKFCRAAEFFFDAKQLVVFGDAVGA